MKKMVFYRSPELLKQILGGKERELSSFELTIPFGGICLTWENAPNISSKLLKRKANNIPRLVESQDIISDSLSRVFVFSNPCTLTEKFNNMASSSITIEFNIGDTIFTGSTSIKNWVSESCMNNLLSSGSVELEGILYVIPSKSLNNCVTVQYILIGEKGIFNDKEN